MKPTMRTRQASLGLEWKRPTSPGLPDEPKLRAELVALIGDAIVKVYEAQATSMKTGDADEHSGTA